MNYKWRALEAGEIIQAGDECDACANPIKDYVFWAPVPSHMIGKPAPDPQYPAHTIYRRRAER
jgi:hypothetical protein